MNRYKKTFNKLKKKKEKALIPFVVAGDPNYKTSLEIVKTIINADADINQRLAYLRFRMFFL